MENATTQHGIFDGRRRILSTNITDWERSTIITQDWGTLKPDVIDRTDSSILVWGCGEFGQHGHGHQDDITLQKALNQLDKDPILNGQASPKLTVAGSSHTLLLTDQNEVYSWGNGSSGQLGNDTSNTVYKPEQIHLTTGNAQISGMACGARHSFIWTSNGQCYSFGNNFNAQLGYNFSKPDFKENQLKPVLVEFFPGIAVKQVACGSRHSLFLLSTGSVMAVGCNQHGQIGNGTTNEVVIPVKVGELATITHISCGNNHSLAVSENNQLYAWGYGKAIGTKSKHLLSPKLFLQESNLSVQQLVGGDSHSMILYCNGRVATWGNNYEGQLGLGNTIKYQNEPKFITEDLLPQSIIHISCGETTCAAVTDDGQFFMWGKNAALIHSDKSSQYFQFSPLRVDTGQRPVKLVSCGAWHVSAIISSYENHNIVEKGIESQTLCEIEGIGKTSSVFDNNSENDVSCPAMGEVYYCETDKQTSKHTENMVNIRDVYYRTENSKYITQETLNNSKDEYQGTLNYSKDETRGTLNNRKDETQGTLNIDTAKIKQTCHHLVNNTSSSFPEKNIINNATFSLKISEHHTGLLNRTGKHKLAPLDLKKAGKLQKPDPSYKDTIHKRNNLNSTERQHDLVSGKQIEETSDVLKTGWFTNDKLKADFKLRNNSMPELLTKIQHNSYEKSRPKTVPIINLDFENNPSEISMIKEQKTTGNFAGNFRSLWKSTRLFREKQPKNHINRTRKSQDSSLPLKLEKGILPNQNKTTKLRPRTGQQQQNSTCLKHDGELLPALCSCVNKGISHRK